MGPQPETTRPQSTECARSGVRLQDPQAAFTVGHCSRKKPLAPRLFPKKSRKSRLQISRGRHLHRNGDLQRTTTPIRIATDTRQQAAQASKEERAPIPKTTRAFSPIPLDPIESSFPQPTICRSAVIYDSTTSSIANHQRRTSSPAKPMMSTPVSNNRPTEEVLLPKTHPRFPSTPERLGNMFPKVSAAPTKMCHRILDPGKWVL